MKIGKLKTDQPRKKEKIEIQNRDALSFQVPYKKKKHTHRNENTASSHVAHN